MSKKRLPIFILAVLVVIALMLSSSAFAASVSISTRSCTSYFQVYNGTEWHDYLTPQHYITGSSPEQVAYCMQQTKTSPSGSSYSTTDILGSYSVHTSTGLQIILENGYPFTTPSGLTAAEARYATANALRFWLAEEGDPYQYNYDDFSAYTDAQLRTYAAAGKIGSKVRTVSSSYNDVLQFSIELLIAARSQKVPPHTIAFSPSTLNLTLNNSYFTGTTTVTLTNMEGGYTLNISSLPSDSSVSGFTGDSGDVLTIKIPVSAANSNKTISLSATGYDDRTRTNIFAYAPTSSSYQKMLTATVGDSYMENVGSASLSVKTPAMADLIVSSLTTDKSSYDAGNSVTVTATVKNQGTADAGSFSVQLAPGPLTKQTASVSSLAVGASQNVMFTFTAPVYTVNTPLTLTAMADSADTVDELDESNNTRSASIMVLAAMPDLDITALSTDKSVYDAGETVTVTATVKNIGLVSAPSSILRLTPGSLAIQDKTVGALVPGASATMTYTFTAPINTTDTIMTLTVVADPANLIAEADETNNTASTTISIGAGLPDLTVTALSTDRASYDAGATVTVTATVKNIGLVSAPSHILRLTPGSLTAQDKTVSVLAVGASATVTYTFTAPTSASSSSMTLTATADPGNLITEQSETNNSATTTISILAALPDLDVLSITTNKSTYDVGETVTVTVVEKNVGLTSAPSHVLRLAPGSLAVQDKAVSALASGAAATVTYSFTTPVKSTAFSMTLTATADPANAVAESDETNNSASMTINVNAGLPDLTVTALSTDKSTYDAGETVTVTATVANQGEVSVSNPIVRLTPGTLSVQDKAVSSIAAGASAIVSWTFSAPSNLSSSSMLLTVTADPANAIAESNETNNSRSMNIGVNAIKPDITVIDANTADWYAGKDVLVSATVKNLTAQPVPLVKIRLKAGSVQVDEMICVPASGSNLAVFRFTVPNPPVPPGTMPLTVTITADPDNAIDESNENNNTWTKTQTVSYAPASIVVDPNSQALEQDNVFRSGVIPSLPQFTPSVYHTWQEVRLVNGSYVVKTFWAQLTTVFSISPDPRIAYPDSPDLMESGFGVQAYCKTTLTTNYDHPEKLIGPQMVWVYSPESCYGQGQWQNVRDSLVTSSGSAGDKTIQWQFAVNPYSATASRLHYTPLWFSDGQYTALAQAFYAWSPIGQMVDFETDSVTIRGDMYDRITAVRR